MAHAALTSLKLTRIIATEARVGVIEGVPA
jgi:hypothetical protein